MSETVAVIDPSRFQVDFWDAHINSWVPTMLTASDPTTAKRKALIAANNRMVRTRVIDTQLPLKGIPA